MPAEGATKVSSSPIVSEAMWRLRPLTLACVISALPPFETVLIDWDSMMATQGSCLGGHLLAQQRQQHIPHAALTPAGKGVVGLFPRRVVLGRRKSLTTRGLHMKDGVDHVPGTARRSCRLGTWGNFAIHLGFEDRLLWMVFKMLVAVANEAKYST